MKKYLDLAIANEQIKTTDIKGKEYSEVSQRIKAFRIVYPQGAITTKMISNENGICVFIAQVYDEDGKILGTGTAYEKENSTFINKTSYIENCETSAVGRALGMCGFGIDVSVASAEEVQNAIANQEVTQEEADTYTLTFGKYIGKTLKEVYEEDENYIQWLLGNTQDERFKQIIKLATGVEIPSEEKLDLLSQISPLIEKTHTDRDEFYKYYGVKSDAEMTVEQLKDAIKKLKSKLGE